MKKLILVISLFAFTLASFSQRTTEKIDEFNSTDGTTGTIERVTVPAGSFLGLHLSIKDTNYPTIEMYLEPSFFGDDLLNFTMFYRKQWI